MRDNVERTRPDDFPELQIGYPERNDVRTPANDAEAIRDMERFHVDLDNFRTVRTTADGKVRNQSGK